MRRAYIRFLAILALAVTASFSAPTFAQSEAYTYTAEERIGFAFYHLTSQVEPPYEDWIQISPLYQSARNHLRPSLMDSERRRLRNGFAVFDPAQELIPVKTKVDLAFINNPDFVEDGRNDPEAPLKIMKITFPHMGQEDLYFPFSIGKMWIAFLPKEQGTSINYVLSREGFEKVSKMLNLATDGTKARVPAEIVLRPVKADGTAPMTIEGQTAWLMTGEIVSMSLLNHNGDRIWDQINDWYINKDEKELRQLYKR